MDTDSVYRQFLASWFETSFPRRSNCTFLPVFDAEQRRVTWEAVSSAFFAVLKIAIGMYNIDHAGLLVRRAIASFFGTFYVEYWSTSAICMFASGMFNIDHTRLLVRCAIASFFGTLYVEYWSTSAISMFASGMLNIGHARLPVNATVAPFLDTRQVK